MIAYFIWNSYQESKKNYDSYTLLKILLNIVTFVCYLFSSTSYTDIISYVLLLSLLKHIDCDDKIKNSKIQLIMSTVSIFSVLNLTELNDVISVASLFCLTLYKDIMCANIAMEYVIYSMFEITKISFTDSISFNLVHHMYYFSLVLFLQKIFYLNDYKIREYYKKSYTQMYFVNPILLRIVGQYWLTRNNVLFSVLPYIFYFVYILFDLTHIFNKDINDVFTDSRKKILCPGLWNEYTSSSVLFFNEVNKLGEVIVGTYETDDYLNYKKTKSLEHCTNSFDILDVRIRKLIVDNIKSVSGTICVPIKITQEFLKQNNIDCVVYPLNRSICHENNIICENSQDVQILYVDVYKSNILSNKYNFNI